LALAVVASCGACRGVPASPPTEIPEPAEAVAVPGANEVPEERSTNPIKCGNIVVSSKSPGVRATLSMSVLVEGPEGLTLQWGTDYLRHSETRLPAPFWDFVAEDGRRLRFLGAHEGDFRGMGAWEFSSGVMDWDRAAAILRGPPVAVRLYGTLEVPLAEEDRARLRRCVERVEASRKR
jgi:hypothetical protein